MIGIGRPKSAIRILMGRGVQATQKICEAFDRGERNFLFDAKIYGATSVKRALAAAQHHKCCYCEAVFEHSSYGDIDHYRPKGSINEGQGNIDLKPGYYWLAYTDNNLLFSCERCNRSHKRSFFPIVNPSQRARNHLQSIIQEQPLILNPSQIDPRNHIRFREEYPFPITEAGRATIQHVGLDREPLNEARRSHLKLVRALWQVSRLNVAESTEARQSLSQLLKAQSQFTSATIDYHNSLGP
jgi:hypothetical protein